MRTHAMSKRFATACALFAMLAGLMAAWTMTAGTAEAAITKVTVRSTTNYNSTYDYYESVYLTSGQSTAVSSGSISFSGNTLYLNNATLNVPANGTGIFVDCQKSDTITIVVNGTCNIKSANGSTAINASGNVVLKGGTLNISGFNDGIYASNKVKLSSGKYNIKAGYSAIGASEGMSNAPARLGSITGRLAKGFTVKKGSGVYQYNKSDYYIYLTKWKGGKKATIPATLSYGGKDYGSVCVGAKAFKGTKVAKITFKGSVYKIGKQAFSNTRKLTKITFKSQWYVGSNWAKKSFSKAGKKGGKKLTVDFKGGSKYQNKSNKKDLRKLGLNKKAKVC